ncbi:hypothetical protein [Streptosporangium sp. 'caverna']|uniref:hypothetical protein n=1 Tax=Streptosporangium sp. 'caverna' TaxID=2202249 RepID=UPI000D7E061F|nr:hypothetical protein [Streptosporangium sp. 'caverna']AWS43678.1 hypothetical protein DKM19_22260 [Streptosporangium sp. 'caverna']
MQAWTANDAVAFGACLTADADHVSYDGTHAHGRPALQDNHDRLFRGVLAGSVLVGDLESIRHITADVLHNPWARYLDDLVEIVGVVRDRPAVLRHNLPLNYQLQ